MLTLQRFGKGLEANQFDHLGITNLDWGTFFVWYGILQFPEKARKKERMDKRNKGGGKVFF